MTSKRKSSVAAASIGVLALTGLGLVTAAPASAEVLNATGGSLQWGIKSSLLNYHFALHTGTTQGATQGDGATASSTTRGTAPETYPALWNFPFVSGSYDSTTNKYTAQYGGFVALTDSNPAATTGPGSASPFKYFKVSNPKVVVDLATGTKQLVLDVQKGAESGPAVASGPISEDVDFAALNLTTAATAVGGVVTYTNVAAALTATGAANFGGFYPTGTEVDPVTASLTGLAAGGSAGTTPGTTTPGTTTPGTTTPGTTTGNNALGGAPPSRGGWFGPAAPPSSAYNPPPWFRPYGMSPYGYAMPPQQLPPQQFLPPQQAQPPPQAPLAAPAPAVTSPPPVQTAPAGAVAAPVRTLRPIPRATGPADGDLVNVGATDVAEAESGGIALLLLALAVGMGIAFVTTRGVRDAIMARSSPAQHRPAPRSRR